MLMLKNHKFDNNTNLGIQILRTLLCFWVISFHCVERNKVNYYTYYFAKRKAFHVPCFSFMSFYFSYKIFSGKNIVKLKKRLERLLIPYIGWPILIFFINNLFLKRKITLHGLKIQLILGTKFIIPLWYLFSVILSTIFFFILSYIFQKYFLFVFQLLWMVLFIIQYSNFFSFLKGYKKSVIYSIWHTIGIFPLFILGIIFASLKIIENIKLNRNKVLFFSWIFIIFLFKYNIFRELEGYNGIIYNFAASFFFMFFHLLPFENIHISMKKLIKQMTNYINGIYCLHTKIIHLVRIYFGLSGNLKACIIVYLIAYLVSYVGIKLFGKTRIKYLFI